MRNGIFLVVIMLIMLFKTGTGYGQNSEVEWVKAMGGVGNHHGKAIAVDAVGNVYTTGRFEGTVDFDPNFGVFNLTSAGVGDIFISKLDTSGALAWARRFGNINSDQGLSIAVDANGNVYTTGEFRGTVDFDPGIGVFNLTTPSPTTSDIFISKLDPSGALVWAKRIGGNNDDSGSSIKVDITGNVYIAGSFTGTADFDPSANTANLISSGGWDVFVTKFDTSGSFIWAKSMGGASTDFGRSIAIDEIGNIYTVGNFYGTADFDPGIGTTNLTSTGNGDIFVSKLDASGAFVWAKRFGGTSFDFLGSIVIDNFESILITGYFYGTVDFNPNAGISNLTSVGNTDVFISKLDTSGAFVWAKRIGGTSGDLGNDIAVDEIGNIFTTGTFSGTVDFDSGVDIVNLISGGFNTFVSKLDPNGHFVWAKGIGGSDNRSNCIAIDTAKNIYISGYFSNINTGTININEVGGGYDIFVLKLNPKGVVGQFYHDFNSNCIQDSNEIGLSNRIGIIIPGNKIITTNSNGFWYADLPAGSYTIIIDTSNNWVLSCPITQNFIVVHPDSMTITPSLGFINTTPCPAPDISIHAPFLRPGVSNQNIYVQTCNQYIGTGILSNAYVIVELDPLLTVQSGSQTYTSSGNNQYQVNLGTIYPRQCLDFWLNATLSTSAVLGQTLCMKAKLYPVDSCSLDSIPNPYPTTPVGSVTPCTLPWDRSSLRVEGACLNDSIRFIIYNTGVLGGGDMDCFAPVRIYVDGTWILLDSIQLQGGDSIVFMFAGDGRTWRLEADQHPLHPGNSHPNATVELCGNALNWTSNLINILPHDDADPIIDIYCGLVTGSYDPNDKTGYPLGVGSNHDIEPNQDMEYVIRFQNTGTDTAFTVVVRDTLSMDLDVFSVRSGASSHDYSFRMYGPRVLEWTFNNIMLPDSNVNLIGSNGFVTFKVRQVPNLPVGTVIENSASIYFDFNAPIFTNTSWHTIDLPQDLNWDGVQTLNVAACEDYSFNNLDYNHSGTYWQVVQNGALDSLYTLNLTIDEMPSDSITLSGTTLTAYTPNISYQWLDCNNGNAPIAGETNQSFTPLSNGDYAVEMTDGACTILSNCLNVTGVVVEKLANDLGILIYPNPTTGILHLEKGNDSEISIEVLDNLGRVLLVQTSRDLITNVNLGSMPAGVYYVVVGNGERIVREKVMKF